MKLKKYGVILTLVFNLFLSQLLMAQCTWHTQLTDGFEYTTPCPDVLPGVVYTTIPQSYSVHSGNKSLYLNFVNCAGGTGTCAGDTVYIRTIAVCPYLDYRISSFFTTTFSGAQCDLNLIIEDANDSVLINTSSVLAPYSPAWINYQSGIFTPTTANIKFIMITNIDGKNGNDLSMDDFLMENCFDYNIGPDTTVCVNQTVTLDAGSGFDTYLWSNGQTTQTIVAATTGGAASTTLFIVQVSDTNGCQFSDTLRVTFIPCTLVPEIKDITQVAVNFNSQTHELTVTPNMPFQSGLLILSDEEGREILREVHKNVPFTLNLNGLANGFYYYRIFSGKDILKTGKLYFN